MHFETTDFSVDQTGLLDSEQLDILTASFRAWASETGTRARAMSRTRILVIFLLIRYTGAKLNEVQGLRVLNDMDFAGHSVRFGQEDCGETSFREVHLSAGLSAELAELLTLLDGAGGAERPFSIDPAFVRRKFYERAQICGFDKRQGGPEMLRKARAVELIQNNVPLPAVQRLLGHSTPNLTTAFISFSPEDLTEVIRLFMERESGRRTSARNSFFGKVRGFARGDVQTLVELDTLDGEKIWTMVTNTSAERLSLREGRLITAEVKAPWLLLERADRPGGNSAENVRQGIIARLTKGAVNTECTVRIADGTELCAILSTQGFDSLGLSLGDEARVLFSSYAVILQAD